MTIRLLLMLLLMHTFRAEAGQEIIRAAVPMNSPPQYSLDPDGRPVGFAIDVMDRLADRAGFKVDYQVYPTWKDVFMALERGGAEIIPNTGITHDRETFCRFTLPVENLHLSLVIRTVPETPSQPKKQVKSVSFKISTGQF